LTTLSNAKTPYGIQWVNMLDQQPTLKSNQVAPKGICVGQWLVKMTPPCSSNPSLSLLHEIGLAKCLSTTFPKLIQAVPSNHAGILDAPTSILADLYQETATLARLAYAYCYVAMHVQIG
jgi:hypothetical protein